MVILEIILFLFFFFQLLVTYIPKIKIPKTYNYYFIEDLYYSLFTLDKLNLIENKTILEKVLSDVIPRNYYWNYSFNISCNGKVIVPYLYKNGTLYICIWD